ncbi:hypothetical protein [Streptomyces sp. YIM 130001]|uniref:hypothetical protein n=1 Tax=Streptomyces sp. YIM 130001 TaxID=2259644 RepID=UPI001F09BA72|nr:hypothetical protein [Streptomyces sp. YIM 130001]
MTAIAQRIGAVSVATGALLISASVSAGAAAPQEAAGSPTYSARSNQPGAEPTLSGAYTAAYRGVQGGNFCLLSACSVGGHSSGGQNAGPSNTQGFNLCLLSRCGVRP